MFDADRLQRGKRGQHHLARGGDAVRPDQLRADLQALAHRIELVRRDPRDLARVTQPQGPRARAQRGGGDAPDLRSYVAAQRERPQTRRIDEAEHRAGLQPVHPVAERLLELDQRRADPVISMLVHRIERSAHRAAEHGGIGGQVVGQPFGQQVVGRGHAPAPNALVIPAEAGMTKSGSRNSAG